MFGDNTIYYNKDDKNYYFRVSEPSRRTVWSFNDDGNDPGLRYKNFPKTLYMDGRTYDTLHNYIPNDDMILKWFNERYNQDAEVLLRKSPLKGL
jgi:hypothetical protein